MKRITGMRAFWVIWGGLLLSFTGSGLTRFGLSVWVFNETQDTQAYSVLLFSSTIALAIGSIVAGTLVDRWNRRTVLILSNIAGSLPTLVIMLLHFNDALTINHLYVALFVNGFASAFMLPAFDSSIRILVPPGQLARASGLSQMVQSMGTIIAPPLAGVMMAQWGLGSVFIVDYVTVTLAIVPLLFVFIPTPERTLVTKQSNIWDDFKFGLQYISQRPPFVFLMVYVTLVMFAQSFIYALTGPLILSFSTQEAMGVVYAFFGIGGIAGATMVSLTGGTKRRMTGMIIGSVVMGIGAIIAGVKADVGYVNIGTLVFGFAMSYLIALNRTIYQENSAPEVVGRIFSFRIMVTITAQAVGLLMAGSLAANIFEPAMMPEAGWLAEMFGPLIGVGEGRGVGLLVILVGAVILAMGVISALIRPLRLLEDQFEKADSPVRSDAGVVPAGSVSTSQ
jgi:DHA3 family macrolide efflux protein-like MFS transporter